MHGNLLAHYAKINAPFLHAYSEAGTEFLLSHLNIRKGQHVLELGCGTGATLAKVASRNKNIELSALESSPQMLAKTKQRLWVCGLKRRVNLKTYEPGSAFPFADNTFDIVYAESVLAFQEEHQIRHLLREIFRILKRGGTLYLNESLWLPSITDEETKLVNDKALQAFGIKQANEKIRGEKEWTGLLAQIGFSSSKLQEMIPGDIAKMSTKAVTEKLSTLYSSAGRLEKLWPATFRESKSLHREMDHIFPEKKKYLAGMLISGTK